MSSENTSSIWVVNNARSDGKTYTLRVPTAAGNTDIPYRHDENNRQIAIQNEIDLEIHSSTWEDFRATEIQNLRMTVSFPNTVILYYHKGRGR